MTNTSETPMTPAGWYPDYTGQPGILRWWDGTAWTENVQGKAVVGEASVGERPYSLITPPVRVAPGTPVYNPFIWILAVVPIISLIAQLVSNVSPTTLDPRNPASIYSNPAYLASLLVTVVIYAGAIVLAFFDRKTLLREGFDRPFHWAWSFLFSGVYIIGRSVVVRRRSSRGLIPLWIWIAGYAITLVFGVVRVAAAISTLLEQMPTNI